MTHLDEELAAHTATRYTELLERRGNGEPVQYVTGETEFYGLPFRVTRDVLIPRPETEHLVERVLELASDFPRPRIVDVGTGSGCIAVALAHSLQLQAGRSVKGTGFSSVKNTAFSPVRGTGLSPVKGTGFSPYINPTKSAGALAPEEDLSDVVTAIDLSASALALARENAERNGVSIRFLQGDLLAPVSGEQFEIVVSNPPYVPSADRDTLSVEVREYEPAMALFAGDDGLEVYRRLIPAAFDALVPGGFVLLEIGYGQSPAIAELLTRSGFAQIEFTSDLQSIPRVACARRP